MEYFIKQTDVDGSGLIRRFGSIICCYCYAWKYVSLEKNYWDRSSWYTTPRASWETDDGKNPWQEETTSFIGYGWRMKSLALVRKEFQNARIVRQTMTRRVHDTTRGCWKQSSKCLFFLSSSQCYSRCLSVLDVFKNESVVSIFGLKCSECH